MRFSLHLLSSPYNGSGVYATLCLASIFHYSTIVKNQHPRATNCSPKTPRDFINNEWTIQRICGQCPKLLSLFLLLLFAINEAKLNI